jgi:hypothetical protein
MSSWSWRSRQYREALPAPVYPFACISVSHNQIAIALALFPFAAMQSGGPAAFKLPETQAVPVGKALADVFTIQRAQQPVKPLKEEAGGTGPLDRTAGSGKVPKKRGRPRKHPLPAESVVVTPGHADRSPGPPGQQPEQQPGSNGTADRLHPDALSAPAPKKRGRPRKHPLQDPNQLAVKRPRGRPPGTERSSGAGLFSHPQPLCSDCGLPCSSADATHVLRAQAKRKPKRQRQQQALR